jgi:D-serine dehydratase
MRGLPLPFAAGPWRLPALSFDDPAECGKVGFGISHPCLAFDKWQVICLVDGDYNVVDAVKTYF